MCVSKSLGINVCFSRVPRKRSFKNSPKPYQTISNDVSRILIFTKINNGKRQIYTVVKNFCLSVTFCVRTLF